MTSNADAPSSRAIFIPTIRASYSVSLLVALKPHRTTYMILPPCGECKTIPSPDPLMFDDPSTYKTQGLSSCVSTRCTSSRASFSIWGPKSATKSARTCDLTAVLGL